MKRGKNLFWVLFRTMKCTTSMACYLAPSTEAVSLQPCPPATPEAPEEDKEVAEPLADNWIGPTDDFGRASTPVMDVTPPSEEGVCPSLHC